MRRQAGTRTDPDALEGVAPLIGDIAARSPAVPCAERGRSGPVRGVQSRRARILTACVRLHHIVVDLPGLARFWTQAPGWKILSEREIVIGTDEHAPVSMCFMPVTDPKTVKNRVHPDLTSSAQERDQEIERLLALGARRVSIGQTGEESWTVPADPEGNESCVIRPKETLTREGSTPAGADRPCPRQMSTFSRRSGGACLCELTYHSSHQTWADRAA
jgi:hypothetical protein